MDRTLRYRLPRLATAPALLLALGLMSSPAHGQASERFAVLVPAFTSQTDAKSRFGRDLAREIAKLIDELPRYRSLDNGVLKDGLKKFGLKEEDLSAPPQCLKARQLAIQINVNLVMCGTFEGTKDNYTVRSQIIAPAESEVYDLKAFQAGDPEVAAQQIVQEFQGWTEGLLFASYCAQYVDSENWPSAIENCTKAVESSPSKGRLYMLSFAQWKSGDTQTAYNGFRKVLELDPQYQQAIKMLGILSAELGHNDEALQWFRQYMEYNPGDRLVRLTVASEVARAGQYEAALAIVEDGLTGDDANDIDLLRAAGIYAMNAANQIIAANSGAMTDDARPLFDKSLACLDKVFVEKGTGMDVGVIRNMIQAYRLLDRDSAAIALAEKSLGEPAFAGDAGLWLVYADALHDAGRADDAFKALDKVASLDPDAAVNGRRASWMLDAGNVDGAIPAIRAGLQRNEITNGQADVLAQKIAITALNKAKANAFQAAIANCDVAAEFASSSNARTLIAYVKGFSIYSIAVEREKPENLQTANATLPMFRQVVELMNAAAGNSQIDGSRREIIDKANQYIELELAIIKRGR